MKTSSFQLGSVKGVVEERRLHQSGKLKYQTAYQETQCIETVIAWLSQASEDQQHLLSKI